VNTVERQPSVLVVEDQDEIRSLLVSMLFTRGIACREAVSVTDARAQMSREQPDVLLLDVRLPDGSGLSLVEPGADEAPLAVVVTGSADIDTAVEALRRGALDFVVKPFGVGEMFARIDHAVAAWRSREAVRGARRTLRDIAQRATEDLERSRRLVDDAHDAAVVALAAALDLKDHETEGHRRRVAANSARLGRALRIDGPALGDLERGAYLHDVGRIGVPERVLLGGDRLTSNDRQIFEQHPVMGGRILAAVDFLAGAAEVVRCHHERWDGGGYPARLVRDAIPLAARVVAVADALDEATAARPEHRPVTFADFAAALAADAGRRFDPAVVAAFLRLDAGGWIVGTDAADAPTPGSPAASPAA
jgi:putative two-component system response regulator